MPLGWLHGFSIASVALGFLCAALIAVHEARQPQKMWVMNVVWPMTALYGSLLALWAYFAVGIPMADEAGNQSQQMNGSPENAPTWSQITVSDTHCGAGCALGDIVGESWVFAAGWTLWGEKLYADYVVTLVLAWMFGIAFQYFNIKPMMQLTPWQALAKSIQADTLSIVFFQIGMYGWMAISYFVFFPHPHLQPNSTTFWFMMQIGMLLGFAASYPVNRWLLQSGIKHAMG
jgi:Domain of unknown function (DUF4396)